MFDIYQAKSLEGKVLKRPLMVVDNLLPAGLTVFAGSPKLGKSWFVLQLCCCVAEMKPFLGRETAQGGVLYLDLEGSPIRIQDRLSQLGFGFPEYLEIVHKAPKTDNDEFLHCIEDWWSCCSMTPRLIVVDTIARIKGSGKRGQNAYEADSGIFSPLQEFALEKGIAIVAVTHLKKNDRFSGTEQDWLEKISGSMGLSGISDNVWGLFRKRNSKTAYLRTSSRDVDAGDMVLTFNDGLWTFESDDLDEYEFSSRPLVQFIKQLERYSGYASDLYNRYIAFCGSHKLPHGLSEAKPISSFGIQMRAVQRESWRFRKTISIYRTKDGQHYEIRKMFD